MKEELAQELEKIKADDLYRRLRLVSTSPEREIVINGKRRINFSSNNYLGLATHPAVKRAAAEAVDKWGAGGTASRLIVGHLDAHRELEEKLARLKNKEAALVYPSGYQANLGIVSALLSDGDCLVMDRLNHASLWDAAKLTKARVFVYDHCDMNSLEKVLQRAKSYRRKLVVTDSVFSMDGDLAPLRNIASLARAHGAWTMIDEAHATGIFGARGGGLAEHCGVEGEIDIVMGTLSKALGSQGGFVCGPQELIEYLVNRSRSFIFTTALAPACVAAASAAIDVVAREPERRARLLELAASLRSGLQARGFSTLSSESQIVPFMTGPIVATESLAAKLWGDGIYAPAIRPPTVPDGACRLRFSLTSDHTQEDVQLLLRSIVE